MGHGSRPKSPSALVALGLTARGELRDWTYLALGSLAIAGMLALLLASARTPVLQDLLPWPWQTFFRKALVTHVVFSFIVWYMAVTGTVATLACAQSGGPLRLQRLGRAGVWVASAGALLLLVPTLANSGEPSLNNYVPVLIHPLYYAGLALLALGVALPALRLLANPAALRDPVVSGAVAASFAALVAFLCFAIAWIMLPTGIDEANWNERLFWGGGHVLQFTNTALMLTCWQLLARNAFGADPLPSAVSHALMASLVLFVLPAPLFYFWFHPMGAEHREAFTQLLRFGLVLQPTVMGAGVVMLALRRRGACPWRSPAFLGLMLSLAVFALGGVFGYFLGVSDTRTPSHYHAVIAGVNLSFMALFIAVLLPLLGKPTSGRRAERWQFPLYGIGSMIATSGGFIAGAAGVPRKTAGAEQGLDTLTKSISMGAWGIGSVIAVLGGILFVWIALARLLRKDAP